MLRISNLLPRKYHSFDFVRYSSLQTVIKISIKFLLFYKKFSIGLHDVFTKLIGLRKLGAEIIIIMTLSTVVLIAMSRISPCIFHRPMVIFVDITSCSTDIATPLAFA